MNLSEVLEGKTVEDFTKVELEKLATDNGVSFKEENKESTIFNKLVKSLSEAKKVKIKILKPVAGRYLMSANIGEEITIDENQASEMVENKDAEFVKK